MSDTKDGAGFYPNAIEFLISNVAKRIAADTSLCTSSIPMATRFVYYCKKPIFTLHHRKC